jgi:hypothetical protein
LFCSPGWLSTVVPVRVVNGVRVLPPVWVIGPACTIPHVGVGGAEGLSYHATCDGGSRGMLGTQASPHRSLRKHGLSPALCLRVRTCCVEASAPAMSHGGSEESLRAGGLARVWDGRCARSRVKSLTTGPAGQNSHSVGRRAWWRPLSGGTYGSSIRAASELGSRATALILVGRSLCAAQSTALLSK